MQNIGQLVEETEEVVGNTIIDSTRNALVIAVSDYSTFLQPLHFCKNDGQKMYEILHSIGLQKTDNHQLIGYVRYESLRDAIIYSLQMPIIGLKIHYYSIIVVMRYKMVTEIYILHPQIDSDAHYRMGFSFSELTKMIQRSVSIRIVTIIDCCYSGAANLSKGHEEDALRHSD